MLLVGLGTFGAILLVVLSPAINPGEVEDVRIAALEGDLGLDPDARERLTDRLANAFRQQEEGRREITESAPTLTVVLVRSWPRTRRSRTSKTEPG